jgi:hypothetical protein
MCSARFGERFANLGLSTPICYWQTASGHEVDLVIETEPGSLIAIECKCKEKPDLKDSANLRVFRETEGKRLKQWMIVARTPTTYRLAGRYMGHGCQRLHRANLRKPKMTGLARLISFQFQPKSAVRCRARKLSNRPARCRRDNVLQKTGPATSFPNPTSAL